MPSAHGQRYWMVVAAVSVWMPDTRNAVARSSGCSREAQKPGVSVNRPAAKPVSRSTFSLTHGPSCSPAMLARYRTTGTARSTTARCTSLSRSAAAVRFRAVMSPTNSRVPTPTTLPVASRDGVVHTRASITAPSRRWRRTSSRSPPARPRADRGAVGPARPRRVSRRCAPWPGSTAPPSPRHRQQQSPTAILDLRATQAMGVRERVAHGLAPGPKTHRHRRGPPAYAANCAHGSAQTCRLGRKKRNRQME